MKLGLSNSVWLRSPISTAEGIRYAKDIGFDAVDIFADPLEIDVRERKLIRDACRDARLPAASVRCCALGLADFNPSVRRFHLRRIESHLEFCYELEARVLLLGIGEYAWQQQVVAAKDQWAWSVENARVTGDYAASLGLEVAIELDPFPYSIIGNLDAMIGFLNEVDHPAVKANLDLSHLFLSHSALERVRRLKGRIAHAELSDCDQERHRDLPPGRGVLDIPQYLDALKEVGYSGVLSLELECPPRAERVLDWVLEAYSRAAELMDSAGVRSGNFVHAGG